MVSENDTLSTALPPHPPLVICHYLKHKHFSVLKTSFYSFAYFAEPLFGGEQQFGYLYVSLRKLTPATMWRRISLSTLLHLAIGLHIHCSSSHLANRRVKISRSLTSELSLYVTTPQPSGTKASQLHVKGQADIQALIDCLLGGCLEIPYLFSTRTILYNLNFSTSGHSNDSMLQHL